VDRGATRLALVVEMNVLLMPISFVIASLFAAMLALGITHSVRFLVYDRDFTTLIRIVAVVLAFFPVYASWTLGVLTVRNERYEFDAGFWLAVACSGASVHLAAYFVNPLAVFAMVPVWIFTAHMALLQLQLRSRPGPQRAHG
jgi:hypothetical protein